MKAHQLEFRFHNGDLLEEICEIRNLEQAFLLVKKNKGAPGIDEQTIGESKAVTYAFFLTRPTFISLSKSHYTIICERPHTYALTKLKIVKLIIPGYFVFNFSFAQKRRIHSARFF